MQSSSIQCRVEMLDKRARVGWRGNWRGEHGGPRNARQSEARHGKSTRPVQKGREIKISLDTEGGRKSTEAQAAVGRGGERRKKGTEEGRGEGQG